MKVHVTGVGGVAMGNLAAMLRKLGHTVTGSDRDLYPPMSDRLKEWKIEARHFDTANVRDVDLCIIGNVISRGNPEVEAVLNSSVPYMSLPQALFEFFLKSRQVVVAAGTHGKTTTTFLTHHILSEAGLKPGLFAGGVRADGMDGFAIPGSKYFVIEGDEYDSAFFDKGSKFLHYRPRYLIIGAIEFDHADIFKDITEYMLPFRRLIRMIPSEGLVVANYDSPGVRTVLKDYSFSKLEWISNKSRKGISGFKRKQNRMYLDGVGDLQNFPLIGDYNARNALAAARVALALGIRPEVIRDAIATFPGVLRRQQIRFQSNSVTMIEDFAHHPTAVSETIAAARQSFPGRKVTVLFEPRSASSHRLEFQADYARAFQKADNVYITEVFNRQKVSGDERLNVKELVAGLGKKKKGTFAYAKDPQSLFASFEKKFSRSRTGDVILVLSNGAFGGIYKSLETFLEKSVRS
ncbi:MAG: UDP-N-acetylmuramate--alanine ligase [Leptospirales bacterium]|nr:UDP-N-acetylmuramate--alanine ligase [Leptospirales bacterium]